MRALALALALDWLAGDPPNALHPVAWFGQLAGAALRRLPRGAPAVELAGGAALAAGGAALAALPALALERRLGQHGGRGLVLRALLLKSCLAWRGLARAGRSVQRALEAGELERARGELRMLVSRQTERLDASLVSAAAIESLAENTSDSIVAPLFYYCWLGLPGAWAYRAVNTLDAMVGYRGEFEYLGKASARLDDLLNLLPARLTGLLLVGAAGLDALWASLWPSARRCGATPHPQAGTRLRKRGASCSNNSGIPSSTAPCQTTRLGRGAQTPRQSSSSWLRFAYSTSFAPSWSKACRAMLRDRGLTASPNSGYPMSAMAGALGVCLEKAGHYRLNEQGAAPSSADIGRATRLVHLAVALGVALVALVRRKSCVSAAS